MGLFKKNADSKKTLETQAPVAAPAGPIVGDGELIAVIAAAIAAYEGQGTVSGLTIRKINRIAGPALAWNVAGRTECIDSRRI